MSDQIEDYAPLRSVAHYEAQLDSLYRWRDGLRKALTDWVNCQPPKPFFLHEGPQPIEIPDNEVSRELRRVNEQIVAMQYKLRDASERERGYAVSAGDPRR